MIILSTLKKTLFWSYDRGTLQYDVLCVLILAFIFFAPNSAFHKRTVAAAGTILVSKDELGEIDPARVASAISEHLSRTRGKQIVVTDVGPVKDESGKVVGYRATMK